jgi:hypothetical protein
VCVRPYAYMSVCTSVCVYIRMCAFIARLYTDTFALLLAYCSLSRYLLWPADDELSLSTASLGSFSRYL